jgi:hypothetical protein
MNDGKGKQKYLFKQLRHKLFVSCSFKVKFALYLRLYIKFIAYFEFLTGTIINVKNATARRIFLLN